MEKRNIKKMVKNKTFNNLGNSRQYFDKINIWPKSKRSTRAPNQLLNLKCLPDSKRSQVTIFIILALAILVVLALFFLSRGYLTNVVGGTSSPVDQIKKCMSDSVLEGINITSRQGGSINPELYFNYSGNKVQYLCYTKEYYKTCVMQKPLLKSDVEKELTAYSEDKIINCIDAVKDSLQKQGYSVSYEKPNITVEIVLDSVVITANNLSLDISKSNRETYKSIKTEVDSKLYDLIMIATAIADSEAHYGNSESMNYMMNYPSLKVEKKIQDDGTRIYILTNKDTKEQFIFATKSLVLPSGVTGK